MGKRGNRSLKIKSCKHHFDTARSVLTHYHQVAWERHELAWLHDNSVEVREALYSLLECAVAAIGQPRCSECGGLTVSAGAFWSEDGGEEQEMLSCLQCDSVLLKPRRDE